LADRVLRFDPATGILRAEAGFPLYRLNVLLNHRGFATPVSPGTQFVTLGGMVASDVHGKNHHASGCFGEHVRALRMRVADGRVLEVTERTEPELFRATLGGMGLTGHILEVEVQLERTPSPWIWTETERVPNLQALITRLRLASQEWPFTVSWVDCTSRGRRMGRGILTKGRWASRDEAPPHPPRPKIGLSVPFEMPGFLINPFTVRVFNALYYRKQLRRTRRGITHPQSFFYPLDAIAHWNRLYGRRGFTQYQCVLPDTDDLKVPHRFFEVLVRYGGASPVSVIKDCGAEGKGVLSFPMPGISIALDLAMRDDTQRCVDALNEIVIEAGGRIYLAKDALTRPEHFKQMEPRFDTWQAIRDRWDPERRIVTAQSVRLLGDRP